MSHFLQMNPAPGGRDVRHVGDRVVFELHGVPEGWSARLRTTLGRAEVQRREIVEAGIGRRVAHGAAWHDVSMRRGEDGVFRVTVLVDEVGWFESKAYAVDPRGFQHWPDGGNAGVSVHPSWTRTGNTLYCAFPRQFGPSKAETQTTGRPVEAVLRTLDGQGYTVIPPSGKLRDLVRELPHIFGTLGCRILHLLPVSPTPTTLARFGRFGSPYAVQDLTGIDPALVDFDQRTTGVQQFEELTRGVHQHGGRVFLDLVINHTGWGSRLFEERPEWFHRDAAGRFASPGAWGVTWEDLVELDPKYPAMWEEMASAFLTWCRRGVDGFRCDAGYKVPLNVWRHVTARVREAFPEAVFLLEGLGGSWEATEALLGEGGMQWAYSELFQNYGGAAIHWYLDYSLPTTRRCGLLVHYSETHDNPRLADHPMGRAWSLNRNRLCALASVQGGFGFSNGVEWLARERIQVHSARGLSWGQQPNIVAELALLNHLVADHPCFHDGASIQRLSRDAAPLLVLLRESSDREDRLLVLVNNDLEAPAVAEFTGDGWVAMGAPTVDLVGCEHAPEIHSPEPGIIRIKVAPGGAHALAVAREPRGLAGAAYRAARARADWAVRVLAARRIDAELIPPWKRLAEVVDVDPEAVFGPWFAGEAGSGPRATYRAVVAWRADAARGEVMIPPDHWLLVIDDGPFRARLSGAGFREEHEASVPTQAGFVAAFRPRDRTGAGLVTLERYGPGDGTHAGPLRFVGQARGGLRVHDGDVVRNAITLLTNGRGGMARMAVDLGRIFSKYDCVLGANLHPAVPVDRHVLVKRLRAWINADGFISALNADALAQFEPGPPAHWRFVAPAGDGRRVEIHLVASMADGRNAVRFQFTRLESGEDGSRTGRPLPPECRVHLVLRLDLEDRGYHEETRRHPGLERHFAGSVAPLSDRVGFRFAPAALRQICAWVDLGTYHPESEWSVDVPHPIEQSRGMAASGDAWSPGWFEVPMDAGATRSLVVTAESSEDDASSQVEPETGGLPVPDPGREVFEDQLTRAARAFLVRRGSSKSVVAGYPWFLDWGRDALIASRGLLEAGCHGEVRELLLAFAGFERQGTLPNAIHGEDTANRETSDAPLWLGAACSEYAQSVPGGGALYGEGTGSGGRPLAEVLRSIACSYLAGCPNGVRVDAASGLVWSPGHFTWMDTNHPAGSPREGYPVEIQVLWIQLLRQLAELRLDPWEGRGEGWGDLARRTEKAFLNYFWLEDSGWLADVLPCGVDQPARSAPQDRALRPNGLFAVVAGILGGERARRFVAASRRWLLIPGALRSLAPLPAIPPLPVWHHGRLVNDPDHPYWGRYEGDEDTRRKPAYHNGTAWVWLLPTFCEALVRAHPGEPAAVQAALACLASTEDLLHRGCLGHLPEVLDGDAPHTARGCDAQAWSVTEVLRVWKQLRRLAPITGGRVP